MKNGIGFIATVHEMGVWYLSRDGEEWWYKAETLDEAMAMHSSLYDTDPEDWVDVTVERAGRYANEPKGLVAYCN